MIAPIVIALTAALAQTPPSSALTGLWVEEGGSTRARIAPCASDPATLCATVVGTGQAVLTGLTPAGEGQWRGRYVGDGMNLGARVRLTRPNVAAMTACRLVLCQTVTYRRAR